MVKRPFAIGLALICALVLTAGVVSAQVRTVGSIVGVVQDQQGAVIGKAQVVATEAATGLKRETASGDDGSFTFTDLPFGIWKVSVAVKGFKTAVFPDIKVDAGRTTNLTAALEVGDIATTVEVTGAASLLQTTQSAVENTVSGNQLRNLPLNNRDVLDFALLTAGATQAGVARQGTFGGLAKGALNVTMDGLNIQDNLLKSAFGGGFFTFIRPKLDNVEEITVSTSNVGSEQGEGAVQIKFVTRKGTNEWHGGGFWYYRDQAMNSNTAINSMKISATETPSTGCTGSNVARGDACLPNANRRPKNHLNQYGGNVGGPIWKDKAFFFFAIEDFKLPSSTQRQNNVLTSEAQAGIFRYKAGQLYPFALPSWVSCPNATIAVNDVCTVNTLALANVTGRPNTFDPTFTAFQNNINTSVAANGPLSSSTSLFLGTLAWSASAPQRRWFPTLRADVNITPKLRWNGVLNYNRFESSPDTLNSMDPAFPGFDQGGAQNGNRYSWTTAINWEMSPTTTFEFRIGQQGGVTQFFPESTIANTFPQGFRAAWPLALTNEHSRPGGTVLRALPAPRRTPVQQFGGNLGWLYGKHTFNFGASVTRVYAWSESYGNAGVPAVTIGMPTNDPLLTCFNVPTQASGVATSAAPAAASCPGQTAPGLPGVLSTSTDVANVRSLYALLTGRLSALAANNNVNYLTQAYEFGFPLTTEDRQKEFGIYISDSWRVRPNLTLNLGLRWDYQGVPFNANGIYTSTSYADLWGASGIGNLFRPGSTGGSANGQLDLITKKVYSPYYKAFAPSFGFAWTPRYNNTVWNAIFGGPDKTVIRAGYSIAYTREGLSHFQTFTGGSPGLTQSLSLNVSNGLNAASPPLLRNPLPAMVASPATFSFPTPLSNFTFSGNNIFSTDPKLRPGYVQSWSLGIQRELSNDMALEIRYVGNRGTALWRGINLNEVNIFESGFLNEFTKAQQMLALNAAGGCTFVPGVVAPVGANFNPAATTTTGGSTTCNLAGSAAISMPLLAQAFNGTGTGLAALATGSGFSSASFVTNLQQGNAGAMASTIAQTSSYLCRIAGTAVAFCRTPVAGSATGATIYPGNLFQVNPDMAGGGAWTLTNGSWSAYHGMSIEFRRRMSKGLMITGNYTWSHGLATLYADSANSGVTFLNLRDPDYSKSPSPFDIRHSARFYWSYELPFGQGKRWSVGNGIVNRVIGGWQFLGVVAIQSGRNFLLSSGGRANYNQFENGIVLNGITVQQLQSAVGIRTGPNNNNFYWIDPSLIAAGGTADQTRLMLPTTPGVQGQRVFLTGPNFIKPDFTLAKVTPITERISTELRIEVFNAFNYKNVFIGAAANAVAPSVSINATTFGQTNFLFADTGNQDQGPRMLQLVFRVKF